MRKLVQKYQNICSPNLSESISRRSVCQITFASWATLPPFIFPPWGFHLVSSQTKVNWALEDIFLSYFLFGGFYFVPLFSIVKHSRYLWVKNCTDVSRSWHILTRYLKGKECVRSKKSFQIRCLTWSPHSLLAKSSEKMNIFSCC